MCDGWKPIETAPKDRTIVCTDGHSARWLDQWLEYFGEKNWTFKLDREVKATLWAEVPPMPGNPLPKEPA